MRFYIDGDPTQKNRPRRSKQGGVYFDQSDIAEYYKAVFRGQLNRHGCQPIMSGPVKARFIFYMRRPKSHFTKAGNPRPKNWPYWHICTPDTDNLVKFVKDCLNGIAYKDDSQVCYEEAFKIYGEPFTLAEISPITDKDTERLLYGLPGRF